MSPDNAELEILSPGALFQALMEACQRYTQAVLYVDGSNPYRLSINGITTTIVLNNIHFAQRSDEDEFRIQCRGHHLKALAERKATGDGVCIIGYYADLNVFSAWDPNRFLSRNPLANRFSLYTRLSKIECANQNGIARWVDSQGQSVLMFRSEYLGMYIENSDFIHRASDKRLKAITDVVGATKLGDQLSRRLTVAKRRIQVTHSQYARSPRFRSAVLSAYGHRCAMCSVQLDLLEAAHIVPHSHPEGSDEIGNGLSLCALHHKAFDSGLVYIDPDYSVLMNDDRVELLKMRKEIGGLQRYKRVLHPTLVLPDEEFQYPSKTNISLANRLRGIGVR